ncbi:MAG: hypothetical protein JG718_02680 [Candidatus Thiothrix moscowensis]|nr:hypothetical protein [Candidatus Thiothrix moscowensis]
MSIATHTEQEAKQKLCPKMMVQDECKGSHCMAWQWAVPEKLSCSTVLLRRYAESAFDGYRDGYAHEMPDLDPANFYQPTGEGWRFHTFEAGDEGWEAIWERDTDPERKGYCAALQHPMAVVNKLEEIIEQGGCK